RAGDPADGRRRHQRAGTNPPRARLHEVVSETAESLRGRGVAGSTLAIGSELADRYRIDALIGRGGMGAVYRAHDRELERDVAIKVQHTSADGRLRREAVAMAKLAHPNVIPVFEVGDGFVVMELVSGRTLRAWLAGRSRRDRLRVLLEA